MQICKSIQEALTDHESAQTHNSAIEDDVFRLDTGQGNESRQTEHACCVQTNVTRAFHVGHPAEDEAADCGSKSYAGDEHGALHLSEAFAHCT